MNTSWIDYFFAPLRVLFSHLSAELVPENSQFMVAVVVFVYASLIFLVAFGVIQLLSYSVLREVSWQSRRLFQASSRTGDLEGLRKSAEQYVALDSRLAWLRSRTGVSMGGQPPRSAPVPAARVTAGRRRANWAVRQLLKVPRLFVAIGMFFFVWFRSPVGIYLAVGSIWVAFQPDTRSLSQLIARAWGEWSSAEGVAALALIAGLTAVLLDHGLSSKLRGRNAFRRVEAARGEETMAALAHTVRPLVEAIDKAAEDIAWRTERVLASAISDASAGRWELIDGKVHRVPKNRLRRFRGDIQMPDWSSEDPLKYRWDGTPLRKGQLWDPVGPVTKALEASTACLRAKTTEVHPDRLPDTDEPSGATSERVWSGVDPATFERACRQAPRAALPFLHSSRESFPLPLRCLRRKYLAGVGQSLRKELLQQRESVKYQIEAEDGSVPDGYVWQPQPHAEMDKDGRVMARLDLSAFQQRVDEELNSITDALWEAMEYCAEAESFRILVNRTRRPQTIIDRILSRMGG